MALCSGACLSENLQDFGTHFAVGVSDHSDLHDSVMPARAMRVTIQIGVRLTATRLFNNVVLFITDAVVKQDDLVLFDGHRVLFDGIKVRHYNQRRR